MKVEKNRKFRYINESRPRIPVGLVLLYVAYVGGKGSFGPLATVARGDWNWNVVTKVTECRHSRALVWNAEYNGM